MDISTLRALSTLFVALSFIILCVWVFSPRLKKRFKDDAKIPFLDDGIDNGKQAQVDVREHKGK